MMTARTQRATVGTSASSQRDLPPDRHRDRRHTRWFRASQAGCRAGPADVYRKCGATRSAPALLAEGDPDDALRATHHPPPPPRRGPGGPAPAPRRGGGRRTRPGPGPPGVVKGIVLDAATGKGVHRTTVYVMQETCPWGCGPDAATTWEPIAQATTAKTGAYTVALPRAGTFRVFFVPADRERYAMEAYPDAALPLMGDDVIARYGKATTNISVKLDPAKRIEGHVWAAESRWDEFGEPVDEAGYLGLKGIPVYVAFQSGARIETVHREPRHHAGCRAGGRRRHRCERLLQRVGLQGVPLLHLGELLPPLPGTSRPPSRTAVTSSSTTGPTTSRTGSRPWTPSSPRPTR